MKTCPKCGYHEPLYWRPRNSRVLASFTTLETLELEEPELAKILKQQPNIHSSYSDGHFMYHVTRNNNVEKIEIELYNYMKFGQEMIERREGHHSHVNRNPR